MREVKIAGSTTMLRSGNGINQRGLRSIIMLYGCLTLCDVACLITDDGNIKELSALHHHAQRQRLVGNEPWLFNITYTYLDGLYMFVTS